MKKSYVKPTLVRIDRLVEITEAAYQTTPSRTTYNPYDRKVEKDQKEEEERTEK